MASSDDLGQLMAEYGETLKSIASMQREIETLAKGFKALGDDIRYDHNRRLNWGNVEVTESGIKPKYGHDAIEITPETISRFMELTHQLAEDREKKFRQDETLKAMGQSVLIQNA